ncbi:hypothetical protein [Amaricoccus solimangrovi]|uniref:Uncharacterized protein n=1 Tax=Amaricoccus solimangrovi TaxID=2589815 RepID=A0A501WQ39_9RHOB|nr:hypothetical protein [Amaricoccus solimangrovi]TPE50460.1 hypothetical protein FJM51_11740 [Amaricoccus solimangrovi]
MNQEQLTLALAGALFGAMLLGWVLRWIFGHLNAGPRVDLAEHHALVARFAAAEAEIAELRARLDSREPDAAP